MSIVKDVDLRSAWRGLRAMRPRSEILRRWFFHWQRPEWWLIAWTPVWHKGRGPYVSLGLGLVVVMRGY